MNHLHKSKQILRKSKKLIVRNYKYIIAIFLAYILYILINNTIEKHSQPLILDKDHSDLYYLRQNPTDENKKKFMEHEHSKGHGWTNSKFAGNFVDPNNKIKHINLTVDPNKKWDKFLNQFDIDYDPVRGILENELNELNSKNTSQSSEQQQSNNNQQQGSEQQQQPSPAQEALAVSVLEAKTKAGDVARKKYKDKSPSEIAAAVTEAEEAAEADAQRAQGVHHHEKRALRHARKACR